MEQILGNKMQIQQKAADTLAVSANALAGYTWVAQINEVFQLVLTALGIISASVAIRYHLKKTKEINDSK